MIPIFCSRGRSSPIAALALSRWRRGSSITPWWTHERPWRTLRSKHPWSTSRIILPWLLIVVSVTDLLVISSSPWWSGTFAQFGHEVGKFLKSNQFIEYTVNTDMQSIYKLPHPSHFAFHLSHLLDSKVYWSFVPCNPWQYVQPNHNLYKR